MMNGKPIRAIFGRRDRQVTVDAQTEPVVLPGALRTCVFCASEVLVNPAELEGAKIISEPALNIDHFVCSGCNDAA